MEIKDPPKSWWPGDPRVDKYMTEVSKAISRHLPKGAAWTDIYNRSYETVYKAIKDNESTDLLEALEALEELLVSRYTKSDIVGCDPTTGHPLDREGMAALRARSIIAKAKGNWSV